MKFWFFSIFSGLLLTYMILQISCSKKPLHTGIINSDNETLLSIDRLKNKSPHLALNSSIADALLKKRERNDGLVFDTNINMTSENLYESFLKIDSIDSHILIRRDKSEGEVLETVTFSLNKGVYSSLIRKISLGGTSDRNYAFRLNSRDLKLTSASVVNNCLSPNSMYDYSYLCVIAYFEQIAIKTPMQVEIEYEYISENLLRKREKPFANQEQENVLIWIYDNYRMNTGIREISLEIKFENRVALMDMKAYPEKYLYKTSLKGQGLDTISWTVHDIPPNSFKNFALNIPIFNYASRGMNEVHFEITTSSVIRIFIWGSVIWIAMMITIYIYMTKTVSEEFSDPGDISQDSFQGTSASFKSKSQNKEKSTMHETFQDKSS